MRIFFTSKHLVCACALLLAGALSACGGGGAKSIALPPAAANSNAGNSNTASSQSNGHAVFQLTIPPRATSAHARVTKHVAPTTASVTISAVVSGQSTNPVVFNIPGSPSCSVAASGATTCTIPVNAPVGNDTFEIFSYDGQNATGNVLSHGKLAAQISATSSTSVPVALDGVVTAVALVLSQATIPMGPPSSGLTLTVDAFDPDGNIIAGGGNYVDAGLNPLTFTITPGGASPNAVQLSSTLVTSPATSNVALTYVGGATPISTTFNIQASSTAPTSALISSAAVLNFGTAGTVLYATSSVGHGIEAFAQGANGGNPTPALRTIGYGNAAPAPFGGQAVAVDSQGNIYTPGDDPTAEASDIFVYAPGALLGSLPTKVIPLEPNISGMAMDSHDNLYIMDQAGQSIYKFSTSSLTNGITPTPTATITGLPETTTSTGLHTTTTSKFFAVDGNGNVYLAMGATNPVIDVVPFPTSVGVGFSTISIPRAISSGISSLADINGLALDTPGNIYLLSSPFSTNSDLLGIQVFAFGTTSSARSIPLFTIAGSATTLNEPGSLAVDGNGDIYVYDFNDNGGTSIPSIKVFAAKALVAGATAQNLQQNIPPARTIIATASPTVITASLTSNKLYVSELAGIDIFSAGANGNAVPSRILFPSTSTPIAASSDGNVYALDSFSVIAYGPGTISPTRDLDLTVTYGPGDSGGIGAIAVDPTTNKIYVGLSYAIVRIPQGATSATPSDRTINLTSIFPTAIAVSASSGNMYVLDSSGHTIDVFPPSAKSQTDAVNPTTLATGLTSRMALDDANHRLYATNQTPVAGAYTITIYSTILPTSGALTQVGTFTESAVVPNSLAVDANGRLYVGGASIASPGLGQVIVFNTPPTSGSPSVSETITLSSGTSDFTPVVFISIGN